MIEKISAKIKTNANNGIFHDSRRDVNALAQYCNMLADKFNQLLDKCNRIESDLEKLKGGNE